MEEVNCSHWSAFGTKAGTCSLTGKTISFGYCQMCFDKNLGAEKKKPDEPVFVQLTVKAGLGDMAEKLIDTLTLGTGKALAEKTAAVVAKATGRPNTGCGCGKRKEKLNAIGEKLGIGKAA